MNTPEYENPVSFLGLDSDYLFHAWPSRYLGLFGYLMDAEALHSLFCVRGCQLGDDQADAA